jgi:hypothetical protein
MIKFEITADAVLIAMKDGEDIDREQFASVAEAQEAMMKRIEVLEHCAEDYDY